MALAIRCEQWIRDGVSKNQSELAHYGQVTTARMTHIMWLVNLAPDIQEAILFLPRVESGPGEVTDVRDQSDASVPVGRTGEDRTGRRGSERRGVKAAKFPCHETLDEFDVTAQ